MSFLQIRGNILGLVMFVASGAVAGVGGLILRLSDPLVMMGVGSALLLMDLLIRLRVRPAPGWLTKKELGGYLFFVPVWAAGIGVILLNVVNLFAG